MMAAAVAIIAAILMGAAWRRWWGSASPEWWPWRKANGETIGLRGTQFAAGFIVLALIQVVRGDPFWRCALDSALAVGFMTLPIAVSRQPFVCLMKKLNPPKMWGTMLNGPEPWAEVAQGMCLWGLAVAV